MKKPQSADVIEYETYGEAVIYNLDEGRYLEPTETEYQKMVKDWSRAAKKLLKPRKSTRSKRGSA